MWGPEERLTRSLAPTRVAVGLAILAIVAAGGISLGRVGARPARPVLRLSTQQLDLGDGVPNQKMPGSFLIMNAGTRPLEFTLAASCGCSHLSPRRRSVAPGGHQPTGLAVTLPDHTNSDRGVRVIVKSNAPQRAASDGCGRWPDIPTDDWNYEYFLRFNPIATAGYSIYIYHITLDEANRVRRELGLAELPPDWEETLSDAEGPHRAAGEEVEI